MKRLSILSGKGGTGKTTTAAAFVHFAQAKAVADCDVDAPNLHLVTQQKTEPVTADFLGGDKAVIDPDKCIGCGLCKQHAGLMLCQRKTARYRSRIRLRGLRRLYICLSAGCRFTSYRCGRKKRAVPRRICIFYGFAKNGTRQFRQACDRGKDGDA